MEVDPEPVQFGRVVKWTQFIANFLEQAGLDNALRGFREDLLVMSPRWEEVHLPFAIKNLQIALLVGAFVPHMLAPVRNIHPLLCRII
jgi:hypothetical protein